MERKPPAKFRTDGRRMLLGPDVRRQAILLNRNCGGLGDVLMLRMIVEDVDEAYDRPIVFAAPERYMDAVLDHPLIRGFVPSEIVEPESYFLSFDLASPCGHYEGMSLPYTDLSRQEIWAQHCGVKLRPNPSMWLHPQYEPGDDGYIAVAPVSSTGARNLAATTVRQILGGLEERGLPYMVLHTEQVYGLPGCRIKPLSLVEFLGAIARAKAVISVDTSALHAAGGLGKPTVGVFSCIPGMLRCKHYPSVSIMDCHRSEDLPCLKCKHGANPNARCIDRISAASILERLAMLI